MGKEWLNQYFKNKPILYTTKEDKPLSFKYSNLGIGSFLS